MLVLLSYLLAEVDRVRMVVLKECHIGRVRRQVQDKRRTSL